MKHLLIFVLLLVACDTTNECQPFKVTISDALPIQFWLADCDTYNEKEICGVHKKCWCHPWNCDDELVVQFTDESVSDYVLRVFDEDDNPIEDVDFVITQFLENVFADLPFTSWANIPTGGGYAWSIDSTPSVSVGAGIGLRSSDLLMTDVSVPAGTYSLIFDLTTGGGGFPTVRFRFRKGGVSVGTSVVIPPSPGNYSGTSSITLTDSADSFEVLISTFSNSACSLTLNDPFSMESGFRDPIFTANYTPVDGLESICNERIRFEIVEVGVTPENVIAKSDCIDVRADHDCTTLIEYSNNRNIFGLVYEDVSPVETFKTRVPAIFFHERYPEEDNVIELNDSIVKVNSTLKAQKLFETDYVPYYLHRKIQLILKHQTVLIDNQYWTKQEAYEIQDGERRWPVKKAKCFLSEKDYVQRAIL